MRPQLRFRGTSRAAVVGLVSVLVAGCPGDDAGNGMMDPPDDPPEPRFERTVFAMVEEPNGVAFDAAGNLYTGANGNTSALHMRRVTPAGVVSDFGQPVWDPDIVIVDAQGSIASEAGSVITAGGDDPVNAPTNHHVTEINPDGSTRRLLQRVNDPELANANALAFLPDGDLLISNFNNNSISRLTKDGSGALDLSHFYTEAGTATGMGAMAVLNNRVYVITGARRITELSTAGQPLTADVWPAEDSGLPAGGLVAASSAFGDALLVGRSGRIHALVPGSGVGSGELSPPVGDFTFPGMRGFAVSPTDRALYVAQADGTIWRVFCTNCDS